jgi:hypothetical protein
VGRVTDATMRGADGAPACLRNVPPRNVDERRWVPDRAAVEDERIRRADGPDLRGRPRGK